MPNPLNFKSQQRYLESRKLYLRENLSVDTIAERLKISKMTVYKYLQDVYVRPKYLKEKEKD